MDTTEFSPSFLYTDLDSHCLCNDCVTTRAALRILWFLFGGGCGLRPLIDLLGDFAVGHAEGDAAGGVDSHRIADGFAALMSLLFVIILPRVALPRQDVIVIS